MENSSELLGNSSSSGPGDVERLLVPILDTLILVTGVVGHSLVILVLCRTRRGNRRGRTGGLVATMGGVSQSNGTDVLLMSLSVGDLLLLACVPYHTIAIATGHWPFGDFMCKAVSFLGAACTSASVFTLAALAFARYLTVVHPAEAYRWRRDRRIKIVTATLWLPAIALAAPQFAWHSVKPGMISRDTRQDLACFNFLSETGQLAYGVAHFLLAFALPLGVIATAYGLIYRFLRHARKNQATASRHLERYQTQVTQTSALLVLAFALCWLPSYILMFAQLEAETTVTGSSPGYEGFATFARIMAVSSTVANPILYVFMSQKFRRELMELGKGGCRDAFL